jgi:hypothetical protein
VSDEPQPHDWTDAIKAAHVEVAVAAFHLRLFERHGAPPELQALARESLGGALDRLEAEAPAMFAGHASEDAAWIEELRESGAFPEIQSED